MSGRLLIEVSAMARRGYTRDAARNMDRMIARIMGHHSRVRRHVDLHRRGLEGRRV